MDAASNTFNRQSWRADKQSVTLSFIIILLNGYFPLNCHFQISFFDIYNYFNVKKYKTYIPLCELTFSDCTFCNNHDQAPIPTLVLIKLN